MPISKVTTGSITDSVAIDTDTLVVDGTNNRVGIGASSPSQKLHISGGSSTARIRFTDTAYSQSYNIGIDGSAFYIYDITDNAERMRIDSSGNLQLGKTASGIGTNGITLYGDGAIGAADFTRDGGRTLALNRKTSDGDIVEFRKDGSTVGSIGSRSAGNIYIDSAGESGRLQAAGSDVLGWYTGQFFPASDAGASLGTSGNRFSNLYLSGGVYLGGTGSANHLDDYEEGTWTPVISAASGSFTSTTGSGRYTKIGNTVHCWGYSRITNVSGGTNIGGFSGLPFASINDGFPAGNRGGLGIVREDQRTGILAQMFIQAGQPYGTIQSVSGGNMLSPSTNDTFLFEVTYKTNA